MLAEESLPELARAAAAMAASVDEVEIARVVVATAAALCQLDGAVLFLEGDDRLLCPLAAIGRGITRVPSGGIASAAASPESLRELLCAAPHDGLYQLPLPARQRRGMFVAVCSQPASEMDGPSPRPESWVTAAWTLLLEQAAAALDRVQHSQLSYDLAVPAPTDAQLSTLMEAVPDALLVLGRDQRIRRVNAHAERLFGYPRDELMGDTLQKVLPERFRERHRAYVAAYFDAPQSRAIGAGLELFARHRDGTEFPVEISLSPLMTPTDVVALCAVRDVTEQRRTAARFGALLESAPDAMIITDSEGRITLVNQQTERMFGYPRGELLGAPVEMLLPERLRRQHVCHRERFLSAPRVRAMGDGLELPARRRNGTEFPVEVSLSPLETEEGLLVTSSIRDVTERKIAEEALRNSEAHFRAAFEQSPLPMSLVALDGRFLQVNRAFCEFCGYAEAELVQRRVRDVVHPEDYPSDQALVASLLGGPAVSRTVEGRCIHRDGGTRWGQVSISLVRDGSGQPLHFIRQILDITDHRRSQDELRASERFNQAILESLSASIAVLDRDGRIMCTNPAWDQFCYDNGGDPKRTGVGANYLEVCRAAADDENADALRALQGLQAVLNGSVSQFELEYYLPTEVEERWFLMRAAPLPLESGGVVVSHFDVTALHQAERTLTEAAERRNEQLSLAVREAHHRIKNNLQAVTDLLSLELHAAELTRGAESLRDSIERIQAISLVHDLLSRDSEMELVDLRQIVERLVPAVLHTSTRPTGSIDLRVEVESRLLSSRKATALALVLNELINNAAKHAFAERRQGRLHISTHEPLPGQLNLVVQDDGAGLPPGFELAQAARVGLQVVETLVEGTLEGRLTLKSEQGLRVEVSFAVGGAQP